MAEDDVAFLYALLRRLLGVKAGLLETPETPERIEESVAEAGVSVAATGQTVVYKEMISVVTDPILAGQSVTVAAQDVIVYTLVLKTVEVV